MEINSNFIINKMNMGIEVINNRGKYPNSIWLFADKSKAKDVFTRLDKSDVRQTATALHSVLKSLNKEVFSPNALKYTLDFVEDIASQMRAVFSHKGGF